MSITQHRLQTNSTRQSVTAYQAACMLMKASRLTGRMVESNPMIKAEQLLYKNH